MLNVIKMDLYRLIKSRSFYVILIILAGFMLLDVFILNNTQENVNEQAELSQTQSIQQIDSTDGQENVTLGIKYNGSELMKDNITLLDAVSSMISSGSMLLIIGIFTVLFVCGENSSGYIKNTVSYVKRRWYIVLSKVIVMSVFVLLQFLILLIIIGLGYSLFLDNFSLDISWKLFQYIGLQYLLHIAFATIITMISVIVVNTAISMVISICLCSGIASLIINYLSKLRINGYEVGAYLPDYLITTNVQALPSMPNSELVLRVILVSAIAILLYNVISCFVMEKRDIK